jgi:hypothetical protein
MCITPYSEGKKQRAAIASLQRKKIAYKIFEVHGEELHSMMGRDRAFNRVGWNIYNPAIRKFFDPHEGFNCFRKYKDTVEVLKSWKDTFDSHEYILCRVLVSDVLTVGIELGFSNLPPMHTALVHVFSIGKTLKRTEKGA